MIDIEQLRASKNKAQVAFLEFVLSIRKYPNHLFCFFEGKDNPYYVPRIKRITEFYQPIKCGGRDSILKVHKLILNHKEYDNYKKAFFIDKDFNQPLAQLNPPIFETPYYSIENFYVSVDVFKEILVNEFNLSEFNDSNIFESCLSLYQQRQNEFHDAVCLFNSWYACLIEIRNSTGKTTGVILNEKLPRGYIDVTLQSVTSNYNFETIKSTFLKATEVEEVILSNKLDDFDKCEKKYVFRGKYELQFLIDFIRLLLTDSKNEKTIINKNINFTFGDASSIGQQQALLIFSTYAETPENLIEYLQMVTK